MVATTQHLKDDSGQMAVELAVLIPVVITVGLIVVNVLQYAELCARFDRVAYNAVLVAGVSPEGGAEGFAASEAVRSQIVDAMQSTSCDITVSAEIRTARDSDALISLSSGTTRYACTLVYHPWPHAVSIAGATLSLPFGVEHTRELVVDRYRQAIVL